MTFGSPPGAPSFGASPLTGTYPADKVPFVVVQLAVTGYNGSQGSFDAGLTFVEVGGAPDPATFAAAIANDPNLAELLG